MKFSHKLLQEYLEDPSYFSNRIVDLYNREKENYSLQDFFQQCNIAILNWEKDLLLVFNQKILTYEHLLELARKEESPEEIDHYLHLIKYQKTDYQKGSIYKEYEINRKKVKVFFHQIEDIKNKYKHAYFKLKELNAVVDNISENYSHEIFTSEIGERIFITLINSLDLNAHGINSKIRYFYNELISPREGFIKPSVSPKKMSEYLNSLSIVDKKFPALRPLQKISNEEELKNSYLKKKREVLDQINDLNPM